MTTSLNGGSGVNKLDGGNGNDLFIVKAGEGTNTIVGNSGTDTVRIDFVSQRPDTRRARRSRRVRRLDAQGNAARQHARPTRSANDRSIVLSHLPESDRFSRGGS